MPLVRLVYVTDTYCAWCRPFADAVSELLGRHPDWSLEVVPAGMLVGARVVPVREKNAVEVADRVSRRTGAVFGEAFRAACEEGSTVLDSGVAARVVHALFAQAPGRELEIAHRVQSAWYRDGLDLHDDDVVRAVARDLGLDADRAVADRSSEAARAAAEAGFERRRSLPVDGYPCLLLDRPREQGGALRVGGAVPDADRLERAVLVALDGGTPDPEPEDD